MCSNGRFAALPVIVAAFALSGCGGNDRAQVDPPLEKQLADLRERLDALPAELAAKSQLASVADDVRAIQKKVATYATLRHLLRAPIPRSGIAGLPLPACLLRPYR
jgi:hypothetical protein